MRVECDRPVQPDAEMGCRTRVGRRSGLLGPCGTSREWSEREGSGGSAVTEPLGLAPCCAHTSRLCPRAPWASPAGAGADLSGWAPGWPLALHTRGAHGPAPRRTPLPSDRGRRRRKECQRGGRAESAHSPPRRQGGDPHGAEAGGAWGRGHSTVTRPRCQGKDPHSGSNTHTASLGVGRVRSGLRPEKRALSGKAKAGGGRVGRGRGPPGLQTRPGWKGNTQRTSSASFERQSWEGGRGQALGRDKTRSWRQG